MKKKCIFTLLILCLLLFLLPARAEAATTVASGKLDHTVSWKVTSDGVLRIYGDTFMQEVNNYPWTKYSDRITRIVVANGVTNVCDEAFSYLDKVTSVYLGDSVKTIGMEAFYCCTSLESVKIPASVTEIGNDAFWNCTSLKTLTFASGCKLKSIGERAFSKTAIETLKTPASLRTIDFSAFEECVNLKTVTLSDGVQTVKACAFEGCKNVEKFVVGKTVTSWGGWNFEGMDKLKYLEVCSDAVFLEFSYREKLETVVLGGNVTGRKIDFSNCTALTSVTLDAPVEKISMSAFRGCKALKSLSLPDTVTLIDSWAFTNSGLTGIIFPASLTEIGNNAFNSAALQTIIFKGDAPKINTYAFSNVTATVYYPKNNATWTEDIRKDYKGDLTWIEAGDPVAITKQPIAAPVDAGQRITVTVDAAGDNLSYNWYYKNAGASKFTRTSSFTGSTYEAVMTEEREGRQVYCLITDRYGNQVKSNTVTLRMRNPLKITEQPRSAVAPSGKRATVTVTATGDGLSYQWYFRNAGASRFQYTESYAGNSYYVAMNAERHQRQVYCVITDAYGNQLTTDTVTLYMGNPVKITSQPTSVTVAKGEKATVRVKATGDGLTYKWYYKNDGESKYSVTDAFTGSRYSVSMTKERAGRRVYCVITDQYGNTVRTDTVRLRMK